MSITPLLAPDTLEGGLVRRFHVHELPGDGVPLHVVPRRRDRLAALFNSADSMPVARRMVLGYNGSFRVV